MYNVMSKSFRDNYFSRETLEASDIRLADYVGHIINPIGKVRLNCKFNGMDQQLIFYVVPNGGPPLLGREGMKALGILSNNGLYLESSVQQSEQSDNDCKPRPNFNSVFPKPETHVLSVNEIVNKYPEVFDGTLGTFNKFKVTLRVKEGSNPKFFKPRTLPLALKEPVENELNRLLKLGILKKVDHSEWGTPIVPVLKPDGTVRICGDYRLTLNPVLVGTEYPLPRIDHIYAKFSGAKYFSKIDLKDAYQQLLLSDSCQHLATIKIHI